LLILVFSDAAMLLGWFASSMTDFYQSFPDISRLSFREDLLFWPR